MSLINDALKRAKQAQQKNSPAFKPPAPLPPLPAFQSLPASRRSDANWLLPAVIFFLVVAGVVCIALAIFKRPVEKNSVTTAPTNNIEPAAAPQMSSASSSATANLETNIVSGSNTVAEIQSNAVAEPQIPPPQPQPKVQGIFYDPARPWAIVSGKTVYVGDYVRDKRVEKISKSSITLVGDGETNVLYLGD